MVFVDLPDPMMPGSATIEITANDASGESASSNVLIVGDDDGGGTGMVTGGQQNTFTGKLSQFVTFDLSEDKLQSLERLNSYVVTFSGTTVPYAIQVEMTHDGAGTPYVVNPVGSLKSVSWFDDGANLRVILMPTEETAIDSFIDFKFYVSGSVSGLALASGDSVQAFDSNGDTVVPDDVLAQIQ